MIKTNFRRALFFIVVLTLCYTKPLKPEGKEQLISITGIVKDQKRNYFHIDKNGLNYKKLQKSIKLGEKFIIKIISRTNIPPQGSAYKSFGYKLIISDKNDKIVNKDLKYRKKRSKSTASENKKGFAFTDAAFWYEELTMTKDLNIKLAQIKNSSDVYARVIIQTIDERQDIKGKISTINRQQNVSLSYINDQNKKVISKGWVLLDKSLDQKFKIEGPTIIRVYSRYIYDENNKLDNYKIKLKEDGLWMSEPIFDKEKSANNAIIASAKFKNKTLSKYKSFYFNVPQGSHYYSFEILDDGTYKDDKVLIKLDEYQISK